MPESSPLRANTKYLIDTNIISELMRKAPDAKVLQWFETQAQPTLSALSVDEICYGLKRKPNAGQTALFETLLAHSTVLPINADVAKRAGETRAELAMQGQSRSEYDMLIAASAYVTGRVIATRNVRDFVGTGVAVFNPYSPA